MTMSSRNGPLVGAEQVWDGDEIMLISNQGTAVRTRVEEVSVQGRNTQGVRVIRTRDGEVLVSVSRIAEDDIEKSAVADVSAHDPRSIPNSVAEEAHAEGEEGAEECAADIIFVRDPPHCLCLC